MFLTPGAPTLMLGRVDPVKNVNFRAWVILSNLVAVGQSISSFVRITLGFALWLYSTKNGSLGPSRLWRPFKVMDVGKVSQQ